MSRYFWLHEIMIFWSISIVWQLPRWPNVSVTDKKIQHLVQHNWDFLDILILIWWWSQNWQIYTENIINKTCLVLNQYVEISLSKPEFWLSLLNFGTPEYMLSKTHRSWRNDPHSTAQRLNEVKRSTAVTQMEVTSHCRPDSNMCFGEIALRTIEFHNYVDWHQWGWTRVSWGDKQRSSLMCEGLKYLRQCGKRSFGKPLKPVQPSGWGAVGIRRSTDCVSMNNDPLHQTNAAVHWNDDCQESQCEMCVKHQRVKFL